jgi:hypothetical protein
MASRPNLRSLHTSAKEFLTTMASELQEWMDDETLSGSNQGKELVVTSRLADGTEMRVQQFSPHGHSLLKLHGEESGRPALLIAHMHTVQFLAAYAPRKSHEKRREIGFHTGRNEISIRQKGGRV